MWYEKTYPQRLGDSWITSLFLSSGQIHERGFFLKKYFSGAKKVSPHPVITSKACTTRHFHLGRKYARRRWSSTKRETTTAPYDATGWSSGKRNAFSCPRPLRKGKVSVGVKLEIPGCRAFQPAPQASKQTKETEASSVSHDLTKGQGNMRLRENAMFAHTGEEQRLFPGYCLPH